VAAFNDMERPVQRMSRLLDPIALSRRKEDYLTRIDNGGWVTLDTRSETHKYQIRVEHRVERK